MVNMNMQEIWHKDVGKLSYNSMYREMFMETYSALWAMKRLPFDWYSSTGCQGRELRFAFVLNLPPRLFWISHFSSFFPQGWVAVSAEFVYVFFTCVQRGFVCSSRVCDF